MSAAPQGESGAHVSRARLPPCLRLTPIWCGKKTPTRAQKYMRVEGKAEWLLGRPAGLHQTHARNTGYACCSVHTPIHPFFITAYPVWGGSEPGASPKQHRAQYSNQSITSSIAVGNLESTIHLNHPSIFCGRKPTWNQGENANPTHADPEVGMKPPTLEIRGHSSTHHGTFQRTEAQRSFLIILQTE